MARRSFTREFKFEAVRQVGEKGRTVASVARDLGISAHTLSRWRQELSEAPQSAFPGKGRLRPEEEEVRRLRRENEELREEVRFLKKTAVYFARERRRGIE